MLLRTSVILGLFAVLGCGSKDNVALSGNVSSVAIGVEQVTLGTRLTGGFDLRLELGEHAPAALELELGSFALLAIDDQSEVVTLDVVDPSRAFPLALEPGASRTVPLALDAANPVSVDRASVCRSLRVAGSVADTSNGRLTGVGSAEFVPSGC